MLLKIGINPKRYNPILAAMGVAFALSLGHPRLAVAQITSDGTLSTIVTSSDNRNFLIDGGDRCCTQTSQRTSNNLFHSFETFSIPRNGAAIFNNAPDIDTIFSRITGSASSTIDGLIQTNGTADFFLINPNGIVFGPNARLDVGGSFLASTAHSILFEDGIEFSTLDTSSSPLLSIHTPIGLQVGTTPGDIQLTGSGNAILTNRDSLGLAALTRHSTSAHLEVTTGHTFALIGGNITLSDSALRANQGQVVLGAVSDGIVGIQPRPSEWLFDYTQTRANRDILLESQSAVDASGVTSHGIQLVGRNITLQEGSVILMQVSEASTAGVTLVANETVKILGTDPTELLSSGIRIETLGVAETGSLSIQASNLTLQAGGQVVSRNVGINTGSDLNIDVVNSVLIQGADNASIGSSSFLGSTTIGAGNGGNIHLSTRSLTIENGGNIVALTILNTGASGTIVIDALDSIEITGTIDAFEQSPLSSIDSAINTSTLGQGNAGQIIINTARLYLANGADIDSVTIASGDAGQVTIKATESLTLANAHIRSSAFSNEELQQALGLSDRISGNGGTVTINTPSLELTAPNFDGTISVANDGIGSAGDLIINANTISVGVGAELLASTQSGEGGNIALDATDALILRNGGQISATARSTGNGGNIAIQSPFIVAEATENSDITANAIQGQGGNISITAQGVFGLAFRDRRTPSSDITASSEFGIDGLVEISHPDTDPASNTAVLPTTVMDSTHQIDTACNSIGDSHFNITNRGGLPLGPEGSSSGDRPWPQILPDFGPIPTQVSDLPLQSPSQLPNNSLIDGNTEVNNVVNLTEATGMAIAPNGTLHLVASNSQNALIPYSGCST